jgi:hypothetical protein
MDSKISKLKHFIKRIIANLFHPEDVVREIGGAKFIDTSPLYLIHSSYNPSPQALFIVRLAPVRKE